MTKKIIFFVQLLILLGAIFNMSCSQKPTEGLKGLELKKEPIFTLGCEVLVQEKLDLIKGKRVGLITNLTGVDSHLRYTVDVLASIPDVNLTTLFGPEHGIRGGEYAGDTVDSQVDSKTGIQIYSLYGKVSRPTKEMLKNVDVLLFEIQDIGSRSYTYISTMERCMESAKEHSVKFIVLDRPNPCTGLIVDGPVLDPAFKSGIGIGPIAYMHGMTIGELAMYFNKEFDINCDLEVVKMKGWKRDMTWKDTELFWIPTSPHIPEPDTPFYYPITGIFGETPLVNIGVGYTLPFKLVGAPWMDGEEVAKALNERNLSGVYFYPANFKPYYLHYKDEMCSGFQIIVTDTKDIKPVVVAYNIMEVLMKMYPENFNFELEGVKKRISMFDKANGTDKIRKMLVEGASAKEIVESYQDDLNEFIKKREKYLLY